LQFIKKYVHYLLDPGVFSFLGSMKDDSHVGVPPVVVIVLLYIVLILAHIPVEKMVQNV